MRPFHHLDLHISLRYMIYHCLFYLLSSFMHYYVTICCKCILQRKCAYAIMPVGKRDITNFHVGQYGKTKTPERQLWGFLFLSRHGGLNHRLVTDYLLLSNHLQMRWLITPAKTATKRDIHISTQNTSLPYQV